MQSSSIRSLLGIASVLFGCTPIHKLSELRDPHLELNILFLTTGSRIFDLDIANGGVGNDSCPKTSESFRGFINGLELDCAPGQQLDERPYGGFLICASPRCYLAEGAIPRDDRRVPPAVPTVIRALDSSIEFEMDTGDILAGTQDVVVDSSTVRVGDLIQLHWRGDIAEVLNGTLRFVDENRQPQWTPYGIDVATGTTIQGPSISFNFPSSAAVRGYLQLIQMELLGRVDFCKNAAACDAILDYAATVEIPLTVVP